MRLLANENCPLPLVLRLRERGHAYRLGVAAPSGVILLRISMPSPEATARVVADALEAHPGWEGAFSVVEDARVRRRQLP